jgi:hypothetical protein
MLWLCKPIQWKYNGPFIFYLNRTQFVFQNDTAVTFANVSARTWCEETQTSATHGRVVQHSLEEQIV